MTGPAAGATHVIATDPLPVPAPAPEPSWLRGFRYGPIGSGMAIIRQRGETFFTGAFQFRCDLVLRSGIAIGAELRWVMTSGAEDDDTPAVISALAVASRDLGRFRFHAGVGPGWSSRGAGTRFSRNVTASAGADFSLARAGDPAPNLWLTARGDASTNGLVVATVGLRLDLDFLDR
jgi:hypothetical protein